MDLQLKDLVCLVTGASTGIGRGITELLAAEGMRLAINSRSRDTLTKVAETVASSGVARPMVVDDDVTDPAAATRIWEAVTAAYGQIDVFVSCTGNAAFVDPLAPEQAWEEAYAVNFSAVRRLTQIILPEMRERKWGRIINITGSMAPFSTSASTAAKSAAPGLGQGVIARGCGRRCNGQQRRAGTDTQRHCRQPLPDGGGSPALCGRSYSRRLLRGPQRFRADGGVSGIAFGTLRHRHGYRRGRRHAPVRALI